MAPPVRLTALDHQSMALWTEGRTSSPEHSTEGAASQTSVSPTKQKQSATIAVSHHRCPGNRSQEIEPKTFARHHTDQNGANGDPYSGSSTVALATALLERDSGRGAKDPRGVSETGAHSMLREHQCIKHGPKRVPLDAESHQTYNGNPVNNPIKT
mmetsp:Transcript_24041/g.58827  ORF Transcript_24041/g.58827 Transcript_24041/m.58827 type:complete len:156 (-) Transcript_24041:1184-1651(-)